MGVRLLVCAALLAGACNKVTYVNPSTMPSGQVQSDTGWYFLFGLVGNHDVWANRMCPQGVAKAQSKFTVVDTLITMITIGIVSPRTYKIECGR